MNVIEVVAVCVTVAIAAFIAGFFFKCFLDRKRVNLEVAVIKRLRLARDLNVGNSDCSHYVIHNGIAFRDNRNAVADYKKRGKS